MQNDLREANQLPGLSCSRIVHAQGTARMCACGALEEQQRAVWDGGEGATEQGEREYEANTEPD